MTSTLYPLVELVLPEEVLKTFLRAEVDSEIHLKLARAGVSENSYDSNYGN